jgi:hypothetical protein
MEVHSLPGLRKAIRYIGLAWSDPVIRTRHALAEAIRVLAKTLI